MAGINLKELTKKQNPLTEGHRMCPGCGAPTAVRQALMAVEDPVVVELIDLLVGILRTEPAPEKVGVDDVAEVGQGAFPLRDHVPDEFMHPPDVQPPAVRMHVVVIVAHVGEVTAVVKHADLQGPVPFGFHGKGISGSQVQIYRHGACPPCTAAIFPE